MAQNSLLRPLILPVVLLWSFILGSPIFAQEATDKGVGRAAYEAIAPYSHPETGFHPKNSAGVFIGINEFEDENISPLSFATDDAVDLAYRFWKLNLIEPETIHLGLSGEPTKAESKDRLEELIGAGCPKPFEPDRNDALGALRDALAQATEHGVFFFTFSSHGFYEQGEADFLICKNSVLDYDLGSGILADTSLSHKSVLSRIAVADCPRRLVLIDACRERLGKSDKKSLARSQAMPESLAKSLEEARGMAVLLATSAGGYSYDDPNLQNGVFVYHFLEGLEKGAIPDSRGYITVRQLADYTNNQVREWVRKNQVKDIDVSQGITHHFDPYNSGDLPLALDPIRRDAFARYEERSRELLTKFKLQVDFKHITGPVYTEVETALLESDPESADELIKKMNLLCTQPDIYGPADFATYWKSDGRAKYIKVPATPTPEPPAPVPTSVAEPQQNQAVPQAAHAVQSMSVASTAIGTRRKEIDFGNGTKIVLIHIPPGEYMFGADPEGSNRKRVQSHLVHISSEFWISETEITQRQYELVMKSNPSRYQEPDNPVENVTWQDAVNFCGRLSELSGLQLSLPTETQWEYAARAGTTGGYGSLSKATINEYSVWRGSSNRVRPSRVRSLRSNAWGLYDMQGNVFEWCRDDFVYEPGIADESAYFEPGAVKKVVRGGCFKSSDEQLHLSYRNGSNIALPEIGFRIVWNPSLSGDN